MESLPREPRRNCRGTSIGLRRSLANFSSPLPGESSSSIQLATGKKVAVLSVVAIRVKKRPGHTYWRIYREGWMRSAKEKQRKIERERVSERESASRWARAEEKEKEKEKEKERHCELEEERRGERGERGGGAWYEDVGERPLDIHSLWRRRRTSSGDGATVALVQASLG